MTSNEAKIIIKVSPQGTMDMESEGFTSVFEILQALGAMVAHIQHDIAQQSRSNIVLPNRKPHVV